jgi:hypothetical protein
MRGTIGQDGRDAGHGVGTAIDHTVEIDEQEEGHAPDRSAARTYDEPMTGTRDPLVGTDRLLVDGSNLLPALRRGTTALPQAALIGRLRAVIPASVGIELVFDGPPERGMRGERIASGLIVRHAGRRTADEMLVSLVEGARAAAGPAGASGLLVVTDDLGLRTAVRSGGARVAGTAWLIGRLGRPGLASPSVGNRRPPPSVPSSAAPDGAGEDHERRPWTPGRGATAKRGNPRRGRRSSGSMPS